jgi:hypothetical protein
MPEWPLRVDTPLATQPLTKSRLQMVYDLPAIYFVINRARSSRIPADLPIEVSIDITDASGVLFGERTTTKL